jgi:predicted peptidase
MPYIDLDFRHGTIVDKILVSIIFLLIIMLCMEMLWGYLPLRAGVQHEMYFDGKDVTPMLYLLFLPPNYYSDNNPKPLILFLHGSGDRGYDLEKIKNNSMAVIAKKDKDFPFILVSPQCPEQIDWEPKSLITLLDEIAAKYKVDPDRIYVTGHSMGGYGTWAFAAAYPQRLAAAVPICGGGDPTTAQQMKNLPIWVFHGAKDSAVPLEESEKMVDALKALGSNVKFTVYPEAGHDSWTETYANPELFKWLLEQKRTASVNNRLQ